VATELDAKRAIDQGSRLAARLWNKLGSDFTFLYVNIQQTKRTEKSEVWPQFILDRKKWSL